MFESTLRVENFGLMLLVLLVSAACADKAPQALFPRPEPPVLAQPIEPESVCEPVEDEPAKAGSVCQDSPAP